MNIWLKSAIILFAGALTSASAQSILGSLRVHPLNSRYFTDGTTNSDGFLKAVYLTGSHTWANLIDRGPSDPPPVFDYAGYLEWLVKHRHNFIRLWTRHVAWYHDYGTEELHASPLAWARGGPGIALDGKPKFDLAHFNHDYFARLRSRVIAARERGIYVSVMLFGGSYECRAGWRGNPFHADNNINGVNGDSGRKGDGLKTHTLELLSVTQLQEAYVRKVVDTVNDLDNVLYEISNEGDPSSTEWQSHLIRFIHAYQRTKPKQHPVGMTALYMDDAAENNRLLQASPADWISLLINARDVRNISASGGAKVSIVDSDHWFVVELYDNPAFGRDWVWKSFCRGHNPILMEHLPPRSFVQTDHPLTPNDSGYIAARTAMGQTRRFAERINLGSMVPRNSLASTDYCLADPGSEYLVYQSKPGEHVSVELPAGQYRFEWFDTNKGIEVSNGDVKALGGSREFKPPFDGEFILHLKRHAH
jgi:hypothetical protein